MSEPELADCKAVPEPPAAPASTPTPARLTPIQRIHGIERAIESMRPTLVADRGDVVALVKPQFELGPAAVGKGGIVRDPAGHAAATRQVIAAADDLGFACRGLCDSPIQGRDGNREFLVWLSWERSQDQPS